MQRRLIVSFLIAGLFISLALSAMLSQRALAAEGPAARTPVFGTATALAARPPVGSIHLKVSGAPATAWTVVQWQDGLGGWHNVEGWRGDLDEGGTQKVWWVLERNFGQGPFRWIVYEKRDGMVWGMSVSFFLPRFGGDTITVNAPQSVE